LFEPGHADHTGGLVNVLQAMGKKVEITAHPDVIGAKYAGKTGRQTRKRGDAFSGTGIGKARSHV